MSDIDLKKFEDYLKEIPPKGSKAPPRTVPAKTLDKNFTKVVVIKDPKPDLLNDRQYFCEYTEDGTVLKLKPFPVGQRAGDIVYWDTEQESSLGPRKFRGAWRVLAAVQSDTMHVLTITNGTLAWTETEDC
jgi:hypothetical protein